MRTILCSTFVLLIATPALAQDAIWDEDPAPTPLEAQYDRVEAQRQEAARAEAQRQQAEAAAERQQAQRAKAARLQLDLEAARQARVRSELQELESQAAAGKVAVAEVEASVATKVEPESTTSLSLWGPRFGVTGIIGEEGRLLQQRLGLGAPVLSQIGWQFELRFFEQQSGWTGINELLVMIGGMEQGTVLPTLSWIIGVRMPFGFEVGAGPVINFVQMASAIDRGTFGFGRIEGTSSYRSLEGLSVALAAGMSIPVGDVTFPVNLAVVPNRDGVRLTLLVGFTLPAGDA